MLLLYADVEQVARAGTASADADTAVHTLGSVVEGRGTDRDEEAASWPWRGLEAARPLG